MVLDVLLRSNTITGMRESGLESEKQYLRKSFRFTLKEKYL